MLAPNAVLHLGLTPSGPRREGAIHLLDLAIVRSQRDLHSALAELPRTEHGIFLSATELVAEPRLEVQHLADGRIMLRVQLSVQALIAATVVVLTAKKVKTDHF